MPNVRLTPSAAAVKGGMDMVTAPIFAKPGTALLAYNYEWSVSGGLDRVKGIEPFDGQASPSAAAYLYFQCTATIAGIVVGDTVTGATSAATGKVIYITGSYIAITRVTGTFVVEGLKVGGVTKATILTLTATVDGFLDNTLNKAAADEYQSSIGQVPGAGQIRGIAILNDVVYAWRNNAAQTALAIYKSSAAGWTAVPLYYQISFTAGTTVYTDGSTLTQGGVTATIKRVVQESGAWGSTAAGRLIITAPSGGSFAAGAAAGGGVCTLSGAAVQITLSPGGTVSHDVYNFTAALSTKRLYGCDGVNPEFEFDGDVLVPLNTGMGSTRATVAKCHKNYLFLAYRGSLQHCGIGTPYIWSAVFGAGELGTGDTISNLVSIGGATDASAMMVLGVNSLHVLYGDSTLNWNMVPLSHTQGAQAFTAQDIGGVVALDTPGVVRYPATKSFGNFAWDTVSMAIQPIAREVTANCSVFATGQFKYRIFLSDGTVLSGLPVNDSQSLYGQSTSTGQFWWSMVNYGVIVMVCEHAEIAGLARTFYGDSSGWVYEADRGRSFAGATIQYALKLHPLNQGAPMTEKAYRSGMLELNANSACTISTSFEFNATDGPSVTSTNSLAQYGTGLIYDIVSFDKSYWDSAGTTPKAIPIDGVGTSATLMVGGTSASELPHTIYSITVLYTPRKISR
jgi:hypothetical protein